MFSKPTNKHSCHVVKIDDHSIIICLTITVIMVVVTVFISSFYPLKEPELPQKISFVPQILTVNNKNQIEQQKIVEPEIPEQIPTPLTSNKEESQEVVSVKPLATIEKEQIQPPIERTILTAEISDETKNQLKMIRGGRHERYASVVFQFSERVDFEGPRVEADEIQLKLKNAATQLPSYRKYKTFDSWVRLKEEFNDLDVRIGIPENFIKLSAFRMEAPHRLVLNLYDRNGIALEKQIKTTQLSFQSTSERDQRMLTGKSTVQPIPSSADLKDGLENHLIHLEMIRGGRHELYASIVFQFTDSVDFEAPRIECPHIRFKLKQTTTQLRPYRKYKTFDSWVRLSKIGNDLDVRIGVPENFLRFSAFLMKSPHRLVVNLYHKKN